MYAQLIAFAMIKADLLLYMSTVQH